MEILQSCTKLSIYHLSLPSCWLRHWQACTQWNLSQWKCYRLRLGTFNRHEPYWWTRALLTINLQQFSTVFLTKNFASYLNCRLARITFDNVFSECYFYVSRMARWSLLKLCSSIIVPFGIFFILQKKVPVKSYKTTLIKGSRVFISSPQSHKRNIYISNNQYLTCSTCQMWILILCRSW